MRTRLKQILLNTGVALVTIFCYSPGFLCLRTGDASILRAGSSIVVGIGLLIAFLYGNWILLQEPERKQVTADEINTLEDAVRILKRYCSGRYFGKMSRTIFEQLDRLQKTTQKTLSVISSRFHPESIRACLKIKKCTILHMKF